MKKYHHILLAIDVYEHDELLITEALKLAKINASRLSLVHVIPQIISTVPFAYDFQEAVVIQAKTQVAAILKKFNLKEDQVFLRQGRAHEEVASLAKELKADLILCGSHGKHGLELMLGSTANGILHLTDVDVLTLRLDKKGRRLVQFPYKNIVLAVDLAQDNKGVRQRAAQLSSDFDATLHVVHAIADIAVMGYYPEVNFDLRGEAKKAIHSLISKESLAVQPQNMHVSIGLPKQEVLGLANRVKAELIVVGSHGHKAFASAILGSTANAILHGAQCDVLVVRV